MNKTFNVIILQQQNYYFASIKITKGFTSETDNSDHGHVSL